MTRDERQRQLREYQLSTSGRAELFRLYQKYTGVDAKTAAANSSFGVMIRAILEAEYDRPKK